MFPLFQIFIAAFAIGGNPIGLTLGIVNNDCSHCTIISFNYSMCFTSNLSCNLLSEFKSDEVRFKSYNFMDEAINDVKRGKILGVVHISANFTNFLMGLKKFRHYRKMKESNIKVFLDESNLHNAIFVKRIFYSTYEKFIKKAMKACKKPVKFYTSPMCLEQPIYGTFEEDFRQTVASAMIIQ
jgi:hypothetical protein